MARPVARRRKIAGVEFAVDNLAVPAEEQIFDHLGDAMEFAASCSIARCGEKRYVDVLVYSRQAAKRWGGDEAVEMYDEDPDASVHERIVVTAESIGRVR